MKMTTPVLTSEQTAFWKDNSYLLLSGFFAEKAADMQQWAEEVAAWPDEPDKWMSFYEADNKNLLSRRENIVPYHEGIAGLLLGEATLQVISTLLGERAVLYKERINFKYPGGGPHSAHQDGVAYEKGGDRSFDLTKAPYISILVSVDEATIENGCLEVVPAWSVNNPSILPMEHPDPARPSFSKISQQTEDSLEWRPIPTLPGDVLLFTERLPHRSAPNRSSRKRTILYGVYNPASEGDKREMYYHQKKSDPNNPRYLVGNPHFVS